MFKAFKSMQKYTLKESHIDTCTRVIVLGSNGMLGRYVYRVFNEYSEPHSDGNGCYEGQKYKTVIGLTRNDFDFGQSSENVYKYLSDLIVPDDLIINCIGMINKRDSSTAENELQFFRINSVLPRLLAEVSRKKGAFVIHITTDCVFDGTEGNKSCDAALNAHTSIDLYGISKSLGDYGVRGYPNVAVIRTSIIGEESNNRSLVEWVLSFKNKDTVDVANEKRTIPGYTNHTWNGVTCLELSKILSTINIESVFGKEIVIIGDYVSKFELVSIIAEVYNVNVQVVEIEHNTPRNMAMAGNMMSLNNIRDQIIEMKEFDILNRRT